MFQPGVYRQSNAKPLAAAVVSSLMSPEPEIAVAIRPAHRSDLDAVNAVVEAAVLSWARARQLKPASLPDYGYSPADLDRCILLLVVGSQRHILGVAACGCAESREPACGGDALRLDGPYVHPDHHQSGIGPQIVAEACALARRQGRDGLLVAPRVQDQGFLQAMGMPAPPAGGQAAQGAGYLQRLP